MWRRAGVKGKKWHKRPKGGMSIRLCCTANNHEVYTTIIISFLLSICRPAAALLETVDLWGVWDSSVDVSYSVTVLSSLRCVLTMAEA